MILRSFIILSIVLAQVPINAQQVAPADRDPGAVAAEELEKIIVEAQNLDDKNALVNIKSKAALLISYSDPVRSEGLFLALWKYTKEQVAEEFNQEQARLQILKSLFSRHPKLARQLLAEEQKTRESTSQIRQPMDKDDEVRLSTKLGSQLVESDPASAAGLLDRSLSIAVTPGGVAALAGLRTQDPLLSDYVATRVLDGLAAQPSMVSLPSLHLMGGYVFPGSEITLLSPDAESSLQQLQYRYFLIGYDALRSSLLETNESLAREQHYNQRQLQFRAAYQAQMATVLAALAPRVQPQAANELADIARRLAPNVPPNIPQLSELTLARIGGRQINSEDPELNFLSALQKSDFDEARNFLDQIKSTDKKDSYAQLLMKAEARYLLEKGDVIAGLALIRKLQDQTTRLVMYLDALKAARKKQDGRLTSIVINEARLLIPQTDRNGLHLRALLSFAAQLAQPETKDDALEFLSSAVVTINALGRKNKDQGEAKTMAEAAMAELNDPKSLLDASEMEQAFSAIGLLDLETSLTVARKIDVKPVQLIARLETVQSIIKRRSLTPRPSQKPSKVTPKPGK